MWIASLGVAAGASLCSLAAATKAPRAPIPTVTHPWRSKDASNAPYKAGAYTGPFTQLTDSYLDVADPDYSFGPEDKLLSCNEQLVFVDLDEVGGMYFAYDGTTWSKGAITLNNHCPIDLYPRDSGYTVGSTANPVTGQDRLLVIGGDATEANVYYSDDCARSWTCSNASNPFGARAWAPVLHTAGIFALDMVVLAGGLVNEVSPSWGMFESLNGGLGWGRPQCAAVEPCMTDCKGTGGLCVLSTPDPTGSCSASNPNYQACYTTPDLPVFPGALATDWDALWLWLEPADDAMVWMLDADNYGTGWSLTTATWGGFGRKVFIKGTKYGTGCWFSTDYLAEDLWVDPLPTSNSMNDFMTAPTPHGPWVDWTGKLSAPWAPRASSAMSSSWRTTAAWLGSGMSFTAGVAGSPTYSDVWQIDAGVCLLSPANAQVCSGPVAGTPDLDNVVCDCAPAFDGDALCGSCTALVAYGTFPNCQLCPVANGQCGFDAGRGYCDAVAGCVCNPHYGNPAAGCSGCAPGYYGPYCAACAACVHGVCSGNGTSGGTGACACTGGWTGTKCDVPPPAAAPASSGLSGGGAAAVSLTVLAVAAAGGLFVYAKFFGGGPALSAAYAAAKGTAQRAGSAIGLSRAPAAPSERASILRAPTTNEAAAARFGTLYPTRGTP